MTRQYNPHINPLTGLPECLYAGCGRRDPPRPLSLQKSLLPTFRKPRRSLPRPGLQAVQVHLI